MISNKGEGRYRSLSNAEILSCSAEILSCSKSYLIGRRFTKNQSNDQIEMFPKSSKLRVVSKPGKRELAS